ncbi:MAG: FISUMP domain-containing protein, partial [Flavobacteriaceae bacterium]
MKNLLWGLFAFATLAHAQGTVTDIDGNTYDYLTYGTQQWTVENAAMETYRDGTPIPQITDATQWSSLTTGAWCYYDNDPTKGKLYNWYAVAGIHDNDPNTPNKEFATPPGWRIATPADWINFRSYLNNYYTSVPKALASNVGWPISTNIDAPGNNQSTNNASGFNAIPGRRGVLSGCEGYGCFTNQDSSFWTASNGDSDYGYGANIYWFSTILYTGNYFKTSGHGVRFVKDTECITPAPTGTATQVFCVTPAPTVANLTATGTGIQWYDAATGGNLLISTTALTDGQTVYASQTVNGCESTDRLEVTVSIQDITITASAT